MNCVWRENDSRGRIIKEIRGKNKSSDSVICTGSEEAGSIWRPKIDQTARSTRSARPTSIPLCTLEIVDFCLPIDSTCLHIISWASVLKLDSFTVQQYVSVVEATIFGVLVFRSILHIFA
jgi:hypothetical protein